MRQLADHWSRLAARLGASDAAQALDDGAATAERLQAEVAEASAAYGLFEGPAAKTAGGTAAAGRNVLTDRFLERNQALRTALLDVQHAINLLEYLGRVAAHRGDTDLSASCKRWRGDLAGAERPVRRAAVAMADDPDAAIAPLDASVAGRAAHRVAYTVGALGEWVDRRAAKSSPGSD